MTRESNAFGPFIEALRSLSSDFGDATVLVRAIASALEWRPYPSDPALYFQERLELVAQIIASDHDDVLGRYTKMFEILMARTPIAPLREAVTGLRPDSGAEVVDDARMTIDDWLRSAIDVLQSWPFEDRSENERRNIRKTILDWDSRAKHLAAVDPPDPNLYLKYRVKTAETSRGQIEAIKAEVLETLKVAQNAAGQTGEVVLGGDFTVDADRDSDTAMYLSIGAGAVLLIALGVGVWVVTGVHDITLPLVLAKLALTIPLLALSGYLGRLASHYRDAARWARTAAVQLRTIESYVLGFAGPESREEVRLVLGRRVFGDPGFSKSPKSMDTEDVVSIMDAIGRLPKGS